jgi:hypothetical protein
MSRGGKAVNDGIDLGDLSSIVPLTGDFLGSANPGPGGGIAVGGPDAAQAFNRKIKVTIRLKVIFSCFLHYH